MNANDDTFAVSVLDGIDTITFVIDDSPVEFSILNRTRFLGEEYILISSYDEPQNRLLMYICRVEQDEDGEPVFIGDIDPTTFAAVRRILHDDQGDRNAEGDDESTFQ